MIIQLITFVDLSNRIWFKNVDNSYILKSSNTIHSNLLIKLVLQSFDLELHSFTGIHIIIFSCKIKVIDGQLNN